MCIRICTYAVCTIYIDVTIYTVYMYIHICVYGVCTSLLLFYVLATYKVISEQCMHKFLLTSIIYIIVYIYVYICIYMVIILIVKYEVQ